VAILVGSDKALHEKFRFIPSFVTVACCLIHFLGKYHIEKAEYFSNTRYPWGVYMPEVKKGTKNETKSRPSG
jgi:hypothetical protein